MLLSYPEDCFADDLIAVANALNRLPKGRPEPGWKKLGHGWPDVQDGGGPSYVDTFDLHRRRTLHLTYYRHGDTRERGMALTALVDAYRAAGVRVVPSANCPTSCRPS